MKKILFLILVTIGLSSCENTPTTVSNPEKETTLEILNAAQKDTVCYKVVEIDNHTYILKENKVVKDCVNDTGRVDTIGMFALLLLCVIFIILTVINS